MPKLWTPPPTFADGRKLRVGELDTYARDNLEVLRNRPGAMVQWSGGTPNPPELGKLAAGNWVAMPFNDERRDSEGLHVAETASSRLTVPKGSSGMWFLAAHADLYSDVGGPVVGVARHLVLRLNGNNVAFLSVNSRWPDPFDVQNQSVATLAPLVAGDYVELVVFHDSTHEYGVSNVQGRSPELRAQFLGELFDGYVPAWRGLKTWADDEVLTDDDLNNQLRDNTGFLRYRPAAALTHVTAESINNNAWTSLSLGILRGQNGVWNGTANTLTVPTGMGGLYLLSINGTVDGVTGGNVRAIGALLNGTTRVLVRAFTGYSSFAWGPLAACRLIRLAAGDTLRLQAFQNTGSAQNTRPDLPLGLSCCWMAP